MRVLYISYDGALDPLGASQIIPYLMNLSERGTRFTLLTFEKKERLIERKKVQSLKKMLAGKNIKWELLRYHKSPTVPATFFDIIMGTIRALVIVVRDKVELVHARSFVGALPALLLAKLFRLKFIFDMRGFWPEERLEGNIWKNKGPLFKTAKWWERIFLINADWIVCLTHEAKKIIEKLPYLKDKEILVEVIPTCVDTDKFVVCEKDNNLIKKINSQDRFIFLYSGSIGTWYMLEEMIDFFKVAKRINHKSFFLLLSPQRDNLEKIFFERQVNPNDFLINYVSYEEIPRWISLADAEIFFIKPTYSKKSSCPTKFAESLACGVPVVINAGVGDTEEYVRNHNVGVVVEKFSEEEYTKAVNRLFKILEIKDALKKNCRRVCEDYFSLEGGAEKYHRIYQKLCYS